MAKTRFTTPVGRLVQGSVDEPQTKDAQGNLRVVKTGPNAGQPNPQYFIAVAFLKADTQGEFAAFWQLLLQQAAADFPNLFPQGAGGQCVHPQFSYKVIDGDGPDQNGKPNSEKEGFAGHWVVRFASAYPPRCFHAGRYAAHEQIQEKNAIKRGYYVRVSGSVDGNGNAQRPGLYVNLDMVELSAYGPEITSGPDASAAFSGGPANLPAGASATPVGDPSAPPAQMPGGHTPQPGNAAPPSTPGNPAAPPAGATPSPGAGSPAPASAPPSQPYTGYMDPSGNPQGGQPASTAAAPSHPTTPPSATPATGSPSSPPAPPPAAPPASSEPVMLPAANGATYQQMIAAGWTDDLLRQHGMMA